MCTTILLDIVTRVHYIEQIIIKFYIKYIYIQDNRHHR